jgi:kanamycin kinase
MTHVRAIRTVAAGRPVRVVWRNRLGGLTCEAGTGSDRWFVKWLPAASGVDLRGEAARLAWAAPPARPGRPGPGVVALARTALRTSQALALLAEPPLVDKPVVCHGDSCAPSTLLDDDGCWSAHVDLGDLGLADRWADLAVATWNVTLNYGPGWESLLLDAYGYRRTRSAPATTACSAAAPRDVTDPPETSPNSSERTVARRSGHDGLAPGAK